MVEKDFLKLSNLFMLIKQKNLSLCTNNLIYLLHLMSLMCCLLHLIRQCFFEIFSKISNLDDSVISLSSFCSRTKLKLHNIPLTLKLDKKVITNLDYSGVPGFLSLPVLVLRNCEPNLN